MTETERMAKEAGLLTTTIHAGVKVTSTTGSMGEIGKFAALIAEDAAKICEAQLADGECPERAQYCADAIRTKYQMPQGRQE